MTFPTAHSVIYRNEEGEVLGWDTPSDEPEYFDCCGFYGRCVCDEDDEEEDDTDDAHCTEHDRYNCDHDDHYR